ncbi:MAG TPA: glycosyltransferase family 39 protein [Jatrophihabitans sp.]|nr:glycosyltransferase family 39 protein [Jatrophihabitans sp.]
MTAEAQPSSLAPQRLSEPEAEPSELAGPAVSPRPSRVGRRAMLLSALPLGLVLALATVLRFWQLDRVGFNSDEAVYSGTAAAIAGNDVMRGLFPIFRAHPLFLQILLSFGMHGGISDWGARAITAVIGVLAVGLTYLLGRRLYGHSAGLIAALLLAVMPYHVIVSRQVLLDGLMTLCTTLVLYCLVRYVESGALSWMLGSSAVMGAAVLSKETSIVMVAALYAFFALTPAVRVRLRHIGAGLLMLMLVVLAFPVALSLSGRASSGQHYLLWQLFRRSNHTADFYARMVPPAVGWATLAIALLSLVLLRKENTWRERLLLTWIVIPVLFFTLWPVKGYQYLLPAAPALALLAGRGLAHLSDVGWLRRRRLGRLVLVLSTLAVTISLLVPTWQRIEPSNTGTYLAGTGGLPGGREAGRWVRANIPEHAELLAVGPSMANVIQFYGQRRVFAMSVSPDPANRNPAYVPVPNPDLAVRQGRFRYLIWDSYTANRSPLFADKITALANKYNGVLVFSSTITVRSPGGQSVQTPVVKIYRVRPS